MVEIPTKCFLIAIKSEIEIEPSLDMSQLIDIHQLKFVLVVNVARQPRQGTVLCLLHFVKGSVLAS